MSFDADFAAAAPDLLATLGEDVSFRPRGGTPRTIRAIVDRHPPLRTNADGEPVTPRMTIEVLDDADDGIAGATLDAHGSDKVRVAYRPGGDAEWFGVYRPAGDAPASEAGMLTLDLK